MPAEEEVRHSSFPPAGGSPLRGPLAVGGFRLGRLFGTEVRVDWGLAIVVALIAVNLGAGTLPAWHPEWGAGLQWGLAFAAAALFFGSVLAHELSHALIAQAKGVKVPRLTLFLFGGVTELEREPESPAEEAQIALVGPLTSFAIGIAALFAVYAVADHDELSLIAGGLEHSDQWLSSLGPATSLLLWVGPINIALGAFNLIPGFPLDGGRVLRAALWSFTSDQTKATRWASYCGRVVGWSLMCIGVVIMMGGALGDGLWLVLIGWFLSNAARTSIQHHLLTQALAGVSVGRVMRTRFERIEPDMLVEALARHVLRGDSDQRAFPVEQAGELLGLVCLKDLSKLPQSDWSGHTVAEVMTPASELIMLHADIPAELAAEQLARQEIDNIPVVAEDSEHHPRLLGMVRRADILHWVYLANQAS